MKPKIILAVRDRGEGGLVKVSINLPGDRKEHLVEPVASNAPGSMP